MKPMRKKGDGFSNGRFDLIQHRRMVGLQRLKMKEHMVNVWMNSKWRVSDSPCLCGRNHYAVEVKSDESDDGLIEMHCPLTWWGWMVFLGGLDLPVSEFCFPVLD